MDHNQKAHTATLAWDLAFRNMNKLGMKRRDGKLIQRLTPKQLQELEAQLISLSPSELSLRLSSFLINPHFANAWNKLTHRS